MQHGRRHREDGPAYIQYFQDGNIDYLSYEKNGKRHRLDGPAEVLNDRNGNTHEERYYIHGKSYTKEEFDEYVKGMNKDQLDMLGDLGQTFE
jgi:hypothetical protein